MTTELGHLKLQVFEIFSFSDYIKLIENSQNPICVYESKLDIEIVQITQFTRLVRIPNLESRQNGQQRPTNFRL